MERTDCSALYGISILIAECQQNYGALALAALQEKGFGQGGPFTSHSYALAMDPHNPSTMYVGTHGGGIYKSTNAGTSWFASGLANYTVLAPAIDRSNPALIYAATATRGCSPGSTLRLSAQSDCST